MVASTHGEEFRDDLRGTAAAAIDARAANAARRCGQCTKAPPPEILAELTRHERLALIARPSPRHSFLLGCRLPLPGITSLSGLLFRRSLDRHPATRRCSSAHDAATLPFIDAALAQRTAGAIVGTVGGISCAARVIHRLHHNALVQQRRSDIALHGGYPRGKAYLVKK